MFYSQELLISRSGKKGVDRPQYLKELIEEFKNTPSEDCRGQVLANLANFAYDPLNYKWLLELGAVDLFLEQLSNDSETFAEFASAGICNLALDHQIKSYIGRKGGVALISTLLFSSNIRCVINAITTLIYLFSKETKADITSETVIAQMHLLTKTENSRIRNLALIFLSDVCGVTMGEH